VGEPGELKILQNITKRVPFPGGYFYLFITNRSAQSVFFNNLHIVRKKGTIRQKQDYYPYGLTWENISEEELRNGAYQGKDFQQSEWESSGLDYYDFGARMYDPVLGRWHAPACPFGNPAAQHHSLYLAMGDNPVMMIDPSGLSDDWYGGSNDDQQTSTLTWFDTQQDAADYFGEGNFVNYGQGGFFQTGDFGTRYYGQDGALYHSVPTGSEMHISAGLTDVEIVANDARIQARRALRYGSNVLYYGSESILDGLAYASSSAYQVGDGFAFAFYDVFYGRHTAIEKYSAMDHTALSFSWSAGVGSELATLSGDVSLDNGIRVLNGLSTAISVAGSGAVAAGKGVAGNAVKGGSQGGLNLFKWGAEQTGKSTGWKAGDYMLHLPNKGTPALNWKANYGALRSEMNMGKPIFDSYRLPNGNLIPTGGFLNAERFILQSRGWIYNPGQGAWLPPIR
jgi:RHS repeat-associated protein